MHFWREVRYLEHWVLQIWELLSIYLWDIYNSKDLMILQFSFLGGQTILLSATELPKLFTSSQTALDLLFSFYFSTLPRFFLFPLLFCSILERTSTKSFSEIVFLNIWLFDIFYYCGGITMFQSSAPLGLAAKSAKTIS